MTKSGVIKSSGQHCATSGAAPRAKERGATMVEATIALPVFLFLLFGLMDFYRVGYTLFALNYAAERTARWAILGEQLTTNSTENPVTLSREDSIERKFNEITSKYSLALKDTQVKICPVDSPNCSTNDVGEAEEYFTISVSAEVDPMVYPGELRLEVKVLGRTEPAGDPDEEEAPGDDPGGDDHSDDHSEE